MGKKEKNIKPDTEPKKQNQPKVSKETKKRFLKKGSYSFALCVIVVAVVIALNLVAGQLPASVNQIDISAQKLYTLSDQTLNMLAQLDKDVTIYQIVSSGEEDDILTKTLEQYTANSSHIKVEKKDPDLNPTFVSNYTEAALTQNSLIVVCGDQNRVIRNEEIYESTVDYTTYQTQTTGFDGEGQITSAINILTSEDVPVMYTLEGHNELEIPSDLQNLIDKENISVKSLSLLTEEQVPDDCAILLVLSPTKDISSEDAEKIKTYMANGGKAVIATYYSATDMPNLDSVIQEYGIGISDGVVLEEDTSCYAFQNPMYVVPSIQSTDYTSDLLTGSAFVLTPIMQPVMQLESADDTMNIIPLLLSSATSYEKKDPANMQSYEREDGDELGPFSLATAVEKTVDDVTSKLVVIGSESLFDSQVNSAVSGANYTFLMNIFSQFSEHKTTTAIASKSLTYEALSVTAAQAILWRNILMLLLPAALVVAGVVIWFRRRRR